MTHDPIGAPQHYVAGRTIEPLDAIEDWGLEHHEACAVKYISRAGRKGDRCADLEKAIVYLSRKVVLLKELRASFAENPAPISAPAAEIPAAPAVACQHTSG